MGFSDFFHDLGGYALLWLLTGIVLLVLSLWRSGTATIADWFGVETYPPAVLFAVVEDLVGERQLSRQRATRIEDCFLRQLDRHGCWRGTVWDGTTRQTTLPPDIVTLAETGQP